MLKKTTLAVIGLAASGIGILLVLWDQFVPLEMLQFPAKRDAWDLGVQALYLRSIYGAEKAYEIVFPLLVYRSKNRLELGLSIEGSYHFNTGNDITIDWIHYSSR